MEGVLAAIDRLRPAAGGVDAAAGPARGPSPSSRAPRQSRRGVSPRISLRAGGRWVECPRYPSRSGRPDRGAVRHQGRGHDAGEEAIHDLAPHDAAGAGRGGGERTAVRLRAGPLHPRLRDAGVQYRSDSARLRAHGVEDDGARSPDLRRRRLPEGSGLLHRVDGVEAPERQRQAGRPGHRRLGLGDPPAGAAQCVPDDTRLRRARAGSRHRQDLLLRHRAVGREDGGCGTPQARHDAGCRQRRRRIRELPCEGPGRLRPADQQRQRTGEGAPDHAGGREAGRTGAVRVDGVADGVAGSPLVRGGQLQAERVLLLQPAGLEADLRRGQPERVHDRRRGRHHHPRRQPAVRGVQARRPDGDDSITSRSASSRGTPTR